MNYQDVALWTGIMLVPAMVVVLIPIIYRWRPSPVDRAIKRERRKLERREIQAKINVLLLLDEVAARMRLQEETALMRKEVKGHD